MQYIPTISVKLEFMMHLSHCDVVIGGQVVHKAGGQYHSVLLGWFPSLSEGETGSKRH
jgi:hypothetical protein